MPGKKNTLVSDLGVGAGRRKHAPLSQAENNRLDQSIRVAKVETERLTDKNKLAPATGMVSMYLKKENPPNLGYMAHRWVDTIRGMKGEKSTGLLSLVRKAERRNSSGRRASVGSTNKNMAYSMSSAEWRNELGIARSYPIWNNTGYAPAYQKPYHLNVDFRFADFDLRNNPQEYWKTLTGADMRYKTKDLEYHAAEGEVRGAATQTYRMPKKYPVHVMNEQQYYIVPIETMVPRNRYKQRRKSTMYNTSKAFAMTALPMYIDEVGRLSIKPKQTTTPTYKQDRTYQEPTRFDLDHIVKRFSLTMSVDSVDRDYLEGEEVDVVYDEYELQSTQTRLPRQSLMIDLGKVQFGTPRDDEVKDFTKPDFSEAVGCDQFSAHVRPAQQLHQRDIHKVRLGAYGSVFEPEKKQAAHDKDSRIVRPREPFSPKEMNVKIGAAGEIKEALPVTPVGHISVIEQETVAESLPSSAITTIPTAKHGHDKKRKKKKHADWPSHDTLSPASPGDNLPFSTKQPSASPQPSPITDSPVTAKPITLQNTAAEQPITEHVRHSEAEKISRHHRKHKKRHASHSADSLEPPETLPFSTLESSLLTHPPITEHPVHPQPIIDHLNSSPPIDTHDTSSTQPTTESVHASKKKKKRKKNEEQ